LAPIYPLDRQANADGRRPAIPSEPASQTEDSPQPGDELPPLLKDILNQYRASGLPPAYLPKKPDPQKGKES
jgi:hypothetical protein